MKRIALLMAATLLLAACKTTSNVSRSLRLGMRTEEVRQQAGEPLRRSAKTGLDGASQELWEYQETTWDDAGWSWDRTVVGTVLIFRDDRLVEIAPGDLYRKRGTGTEPSIRVEQNVINH